jgi:hypothetical protein
MEHKEQLPICALQYRIMNEKLNEIGADVKQLVEDKSKQAAINMQVLRAIEDINRKNEEQEEYLDNLKLFAWIGKNWKELIASLLALGGLIVAYLALKK